MPETEKKVKTKEKSVKAVKKTQKKSVSVKSVVEDEKKPIRQAQGGAAKKVVIKEKSKTEKAAKPVEKTKPTFAGFAVIRIGGKQYKVKEAEVIEVEKVEGKEGDAFDIKEVLLVKEGENIKIGDPLVKDAKVKASVVSQNKGEKLVIFKYKAKKRYRRKTGHRQKLTQIRIEKIEV